MNRFPYLAAEVRAYGLCGAMARAWVTTKWRAHSGIIFRSTAPHGRRHSDWPHGGSVYVRGKDETAMFFRAFADAVEGVCRGGRGVVDVVSDYGDTPPEVGIHDDAWTPSPWHAPHPAADLVAKLAVDGDLQLVAMRPWCRTVSTTAGPAHERYTKSSALCVLEARQAGLLAESLRRFFAET